MKFIKIFALVLGYSVIAGFSMASMVASAGIIPPRVIDGDETSVTIKAVSRLNSAAVQSAADEYCEQYGKSARLAQQLVLNRFTYDCVESDSATPVQDSNDEIPAETTPESESQSDDKCTVQQVLKLRDAGLSDNQIQAACE